MDKILGLSRADRLRGLLHDHGERWQITEHDNGTWTAVERPTPTALHVIVAYTPEELRAKLERAGGG